MLGFIVYWGVDKNFGTSSAVKSRTYIAEIQETITYQ